MAKIKIEIPNFSNIVFEQEISDKFAYKIFKRLTEKKTEDKENKEEDVI